MSWFAKWSIRTRLLMAFLSVLLLSGVLIYFSIRSIQSITFFKSVNEKLETLELNLTVEELAVKEFIYEGYKTAEFHQQNISPQIDHFYTSNKKCQEILAFLQLHGSEHQSQWAELKSTQIAIQKQFDSLRQLFKARGFKDFGLEGSLRKAVHEVENSQAKFDKTLLLTLRRNEKDFFLRKDLKYQRDFAKNLELFVSNVSRDATLTLLAEKYGKEFNRVVELEQTVGLTENAGIRGRLKSNLERSRPQLSQVKTEMIAANETAVLKSQSRLMIMFVIQLALGITLAVSYSRIISRSIKSIRDAMTSLAAGKFPEKLKIVSAEEIGQTKAALNQLVERVHSAVDFASALGNGDLNATYNEAFRQDVLAVALIQMQDKIREADDRQFKINWVNEGIAQIANITKNERQGLEELSEVILANLVKYVGANQGVLYSLETITLHAVAHYGTSKQGTSKNAIELGEGLVGQCAVDGTTQNLTNLPNQYFKISSGLGNASPRNVVLVPLLLERKVYGVLEVASLEVLPFYKVAFLERAAESVALLVFNRQTSVVTDQLLEQAKEKTFALQQQEEEMRQNMEELVALQEQLRRRTDESETRVKLINNAGIGIVEFDQKGMVLQANQSFLSKSGYSEWEVVGREIESFFLPKINLSDLLAELKTSETQHIELELSSKTGKSSAVKVTCTALANNNGDTLRIVAIIVDLPTYRQRVVTLTEFE
ncbi:MAG: PAS domain-containing protein [Bacteroidota bacterium]|jgi:PAS domain S-box-containing protein|nr:PAS domain-containing protein [Cytophagales bacterium]MCE2957385.1 PAS domain-containing protein [Flammeovirgaceae bacterium]MCZ8068737.1 PAS domain-containing protein [Cytophagales bacterium]